jgi:hypothetical protein
MFRSSRRLVERGKKQELQFDRLNDEAADILFPYDREPPRSSYSWPPFDRKMTPFVPPGKENAPALELLEWKEKLERS